MSKQENNEYRNKSVINQRGATVEINNSTDREEIKVSQYSGSNITINNNVNSELATNNKQTKVINDSFESVGTDKSVYVGGDSITRVQKNTYDIKGVSNQNEVDQVKAWRELHRPIANNNSQFWIQRGGESYPNGVETNLSGQRNVNPTLNQQIYSVENSFPGYLLIPARTSKVDQVAVYAPVAQNARVGSIARARGVNIGIDIEKAAGRTGSSAPGVIEFGPDVSASTEKGTWQANPNRAQVAENIKNTQILRSIIESNIGTGGDEIEAVKRHKIETIGTITNNFPSVRIDPKGRSQPIETIVGETGAFVNLDYIPHVEEVDNDMNFPVGNYTLNVGNKYNVLVGSGGIQIKTSGGIELGGSTIKMAGHKVNVHAAAGITIASESSVEIQSLKTIQLRTNRQVFIDSALGIKNNTVISGGLYTEGEVYLHHITAPAEIQQTEDTTSFGKFAATTSRTLQIGETLIGGTWFPTYALADDDLVINYPHSHHFLNVPLRLTDANGDVRRLAQAEAINNHGSRSLSLPTVHARKVPIKIVD
jgi:hypothetical protein